MIPDDLPNDVPWRLIVDPAGDGRFNMAADVHLLETATSPSVRLYEWSEPTLSLGRFSRGLAGRGQGVATVNRPTGGGPLLHDGDLTYSVVLPDFRGRGVRAIYRAITAWLCDALNSLGYESTPADVGPTLAKRGKVEACFDRTESGEIKLAGRKWVGSAQRCLSGRLLQHGSLVREPDPALHQRLFPNSEPPLRLSELNLPPVTAEQLGQALFQGQEHELVPWSKDELAAIQSIRDRWR